MPFPVMALARGNMAQEILRHATKEGIEFDGKQTSVNIREP